MLAFSLSQPIFYDGLRFGGVPEFVDCAERIDFETEKCKDLRICVLEGTSFEVSVRQLFPSSSIKLIKATRGSEALANELDSDLCNAIAGGIPEVAKSNMLKMGSYTGNYMVGNELFSVERYSLVTRQDDKQWSTFCNWIVSALLYADEQGITSEMAYEDLPLIHLFSNDYMGMFQDAVSAVGSFGQIYARHIGDEFQRTGPNDLNLVPFQPQHFPLF